MSEPKVIYSNPFIFTVTSMGIMGGLIGLIFGVANGSGPIGMIFGAFFMVLMSFLVIFLNKNESLARYSICAFLTPSSLPSSETSVPKLPPASPCEY